MKGKNFSTNDAGKEYRFEQEGLNVWRSHFDGGLRKKQRRAAQRSGTAWRLFPARAEEFYRGCKVCH
ncbi:hypothetical protein D7V90_20205 [bacterium 1xD42-87]|nr:hypothetical protein D7V90_20205 [bacterium 1xD42-87]